MRGDALENLSDWRTTPAAKLQTRKLLEQRAGIQNLTLHATEEAKAALAKLSMNLEEAEQVIKEVMQEAVAEYTKEKPDLRLMSTCALFMSHEGNKVYVPGSSLNASNRLSTAADVNALYDGVHAQEAQRSDLVAIAYYGKDKVPVHMDELGLLSQYAGRRDIIITTIREDDDGKNGCLVLRTIENYAPLPYLKKEKVKQPEEA